MSNYKYKLAYKVSSKKELDDLAAKLINLGYIAESITYAFITDYLVTNFRNESNKFSNVSNNEFGNHDRELITNKDLFLALAAMRNDDEFHVGEYVVRYINPRNDLPLGHIAQVKLNSLNKLFIDEGNAVTNLVEEYWRKATKEELINHFSKQDNKTMDKSFTVEGNIHLREALVKDLNESGIEVYGLGTMTYDYLTPFIKSDSVKIQGHTIPSIIHYKLPEQYNEAKQAFLDLLPKDIIYKLKCDSGEFDIKITKETVEFNEHKESFVYIDSLLYHLKGLSGILNCKVEIPPLVIGCGKQLQGVTAKHLQDIIDLHNKHFKG